jgi:hypothetical protein
MKGDMVTHQLDCAVAGSAASALSSPALVAAIHTAISPHGGLYAMPSLCGSAEATREWFRAFAAHSFLTCHPPARRHRKRSLKTVIEAARKGGASHVVTVERVFDG